MINLLMYMRTWEKGGGALISAFLPSNKLMGRSKLKAFADKYMAVTVRFVCKKVENINRVGENAG